MLTIQSNKIDITPKEPVYLAGFANRIGPSHGVHRPLSSRCIILKDSASTFCFISNDLMEMKNSLIKKIKDLISEETLIPSSQIFIHNIHTHSAPIMDGMGLTENLANKSYEEITTIAITSNAISTINNKQGFKSCRIKVGTGKSTIGLHRRTIEASTGQCIISSKNNTSNDPVVSVLQFVDQEENILANIINYACHPVSLGPESLKVSPDFVGKTRETIEEKWGGMAIFFNGAAGDINPIGDPLNDLNNTDKLGGLLGNSVLETSFKHVSVECLSFQTDFAKLPFQIQHISQKIIQEQATKKKEEHTGFVGWKEKIDDWSNQQQKYLSKDKFLGREVQLNVLKMGSILLIICQGELFSSYHIAFRNMFPEYTVFFFGYTNGESGYLPDQEAFDIGGYEVEQAYVFFNEPSPLAPSADGILKNAVSDLVNNVIKS